MYKLLIPLAGLLLCAGCQEDFDHRMLREAQEFTLKHCPYRAEAGTVLDSATYDLSSRTFIRWFSLHGELDTPAARAAAQQNLSFVKEGLKRELRGDTSWETCKAEGIRFAYVYRSSSCRDELFRIVLTPEDYRH